MQNEGVENFSNIDLVIWQMRNISEAVSNFHTRGLITGDAAIFCGHIYMLKFLKVLALEGLLKYISHFIGPTYIQWTDGRTDRRMLPSTLSPSFAVDNYIDLVDSAEMTQEGNHRTYVKN